MSKDGPPISGGYRYGEVEALRTGLPTSAMATRRKPTVDELEARKTLVKFAAYPERTKSIGKPLPTTVGVSKRRAESLRRIEELRQKELADMTVTLFQDGDLKIKWVYGGAHKNRLVEEDSAGISRISITYGNKDRALYAWFHDRVRWCK
ncbi:hypothetical protein ACQR0V_09950 [Bradyrhizobium sp. HKCCYLS2058]|uniref:hypothetical protein n=1 Tax=unclassified Bradyrhizobium TaxID=2631580 RepID=UPI003EBA581D